MANIEVPNSLNNFDSSGKPQQSVSNAYSAEDMMNNNRGMSSVELDDANKIKVTIADKDTPLVVLFGPPSCGKTMTLIRLTRYLLSQGYTVQPVTSFRPLYDKNYSDMCENFDSLIGSEEAARSTSKINFMLVQVRKKGKPFCQILEGPGEYYFNPGNPHAPFPKYVYAIINSPNRKIWSVFLEPENTNKRMDIGDRRNYVDRIGKLKDRLNPHDKILFIFNKIDETPFVQGQGRVNYPPAIQYLDSQYQGLFSKFMNENPITKLWKKYNFHLVAFQTGNFAEAADGTLTFEQGPDVYPDKLWKTLVNQIRG